MKRRRVATAALVTAAVLAILAVDNYFPVRGLPSAALLAVVAFAASRELCRVLESAGFHTYRSLTAFAGFVVALLPAGMQVLDSEVSSFAAQAGVVFGFVVITFALALREEEKPAGARAAVAGTFVLIYVGFALSFLVRLRGLPEVGGGLMLFALGCAKVGDMGAYVVGSTFGKHLLAPRVSPKKTIEGGIGALAASLLMAVLILPFVDGKIGVWTLLWWAVVLSMFAQFGDLAESLLKRSGAVKDSAGVLGAMGGALDAVDSVLLSAPAAYILALLGGFGGS